MRRAWVALLAGVLLLGVGCAPVAGTPSPAEPTGLTLPPRPRDVRIDGVEPCSLLTAEQKAALGLDARALSDSAPSVLYLGSEVPLCAMRGFEPRAISVGLSIVTAVGVELFTSGELDAEIRAVEVRGFPAVLAVPTRFTEFCSVIVDVGPGQLLDVHLADGGRLPPIPQDQLCRDAEHVADAAMATLLALR